MGGHERRGSIRRGPGNSSPEAQEEGQRGLEEGTLSSHEEEMGQGEEGGKVEPVIAIV